MSRCGADHGRATLAEAELAAFGGTDLEDARPLEELQRRAMAVTSSDWWRRAGGPPVTVAAARSSARSSSARDHGRVVAVTVAGSQRDLGTLAHELAHALAGVGDGHGARFRAALVDVTAVLGGPGAAADLAAELGRFGLAIAHRPWPPPEGVRGSGFATCGT